MNRANKKNVPTDLPSLMPESCFMDLQQFNSKEVADHIEDKEAHKKTLHQMLKQAIKEKRNHK